jgi:predicted nucleotidyltransferase
LQQKRIAARPTDDPILKRFKVALDGIYGDNIDRVVLFGSRARGEALPDSDYDVAVFLRELSDRWQELDRLADIGSEILDDAGKLVHAIPFVASAWRDRTPLMHEIRKDGVNL